jgi:hypothetical protein
MNDPTAAKTPEQIAQIKRLAPPIAIAALVMAVAGIVLLLSVHVDDRRPPSIMGFNLSTCAMLMGIGILLWAKGATAVRWTIWVSLAAVVIAASGTPVFIKGVVDHRKAMEQRELDNAAAIAAAARAYAIDNGGVYPPNFDTLLEQHRVSSNDLHSPYGSDETADKLRDLAQSKISQADFDHWFAHHSDYQYQGANLRIPTNSSPATAPTALPSEILVVTGFHPIMRIRLVVAFVDGTTRLVSLDETEAVVQASNAARRRAGLPEMRPPDAIQRARSQQRKANPERQP